MSRVESAGQSDARGLARRFTVLIEQRAGGRGFRGEVRFLDRNQVRVARELTGDSCREVADAVALVTVLAINAQDEPVVPETDPELTPDVLPAPRTRTWSIPVELAQDAEAMSGSGEGSTTPLKLASGPRGAEEGRAEAARAPPTEEQPEGRAHGSQGAWALRPSGLATFDTGSGTPAAYGAELGLAVARTTLSHRLALRLRYASPGVVEHDGERARFDVVAAGAAVCLAPWTWRALGATACPTVQAGAMWGAGRESAVIRTGNIDSKFWAAAGLLGRLELALTQSFYLDGQLEAMVTLARPTFRFESPVKTMRSTPFLGVSAAVGAGIWLERANSGPERWTGASFAGSAGAQDGIAGRTP